MIQGTVGFDYRNDPDIEPLRDRATVVLSARAPIDKVASLKEGGSRVLVWLQPFIGTWQGDEIHDHPVDDAVWKAVHRFGYAIVKNASGAPVAMDDPSSGVVNAFALDFSNFLFASTLVRDLSGLLAHFDGWLFDYGCADIAWMNEFRSMTFSPSFWKNWAIGYSAYRGSFKALRGGGVSLSQCNAVQPCSDGLVLEQVGLGGGRLTPYARALYLASVTQGTILLCQTKIDADRRAIAAIAALTQSSFHWGTCSHLENDPAPETALDLGRCVSALERKYDVYWRVFEDGVVVLNLGASPFALGKTNMVSPGDALFVRFGKPWATLPAWD